MEKQTNVTLTLPLPACDTPLGFIIRSMCSKCVDIDKLFVGQADIEDVVSLTAGAFNDINYNEINDVIRLPVLCEMDGTIAFSIGHADVGLKSIWLKELKTRLVFDPLTSNIAPGTNIPCMVVWRADRDTVILGFKPHKE